MPRNDKWDQWYEKLGAAKPETKEWYEIAAMMENHHVRAGIVNREPYDAKELLGVAQRALESAQSALGENHPRAAEAMQNLGFYYVAIKKEPERGTDYFQKARALAGDRNPVLAQTYYCLGIYWYKERNAVKAEEVLREALAIQQEDPNAEPEDLAQTLLMLSYATAVTSGVVAAINWAQKAVQFLSAKAPGSELMEDIKNRMNDLRKS